MEEELIKAYRISDTKRITEQLPFYNLLIAAIKSQRTPRQITVLAKKLGMFIPHVFRAGIDSYNYFINNFLDYHLVMYHHFPKKTGREPDYTIIEKYSDEVILQYLPGFSWTSRKDLERKYKMMQLQKNTYPLDWLGAIVVHYPSERYFLKEKEDDKDNKVLICRRNQFHLVL